MRETEFFFPSYDSVSTIRALLWEPDEKTEEATGEEEAGGAQKGSAHRPPRALLQILHGMAEHIERYREFAAFLTAHGIVVCGHDHIGHGKSIASPDERGRMPRGGREILVEDAHRLRQLVQERQGQRSGAAVGEGAGAGAGANEGAGKGAGAVAGAGAGAGAGATAAPLPYLMLGHSMGSFVLRNYLARPAYAKGLAAVILSGTGQQPALLTAAGLLAARLICATRGIRHISPLLFNLSVGSYSKQIPGGRTPLDWLSADEAVVDAYIASPDCGFAFDVGGNLALIGLTNAMVKRSATLAVPRTLPLLFISGSEDPVGEKGAGVRRAVAQYEAAGLSEVTLLLYEGMRHEVLNERGREQVYRDLVQWIEKRIK